MKLGSCLAQRQAVLVGLAVLVSAASGTTSSGGPECAIAGGINEVEVWAASDVQDLRDLLAYCSGGAIDVTWHGRVSVDDTLYVLDGASLTVTGVYDASSSSTSVGSGDDNVADDSASASAVVDGGYRTLYGLFEVYNGSTLSLDNMVLEKGYSIGGGGAISTGGEAKNTVNVNDCTFQDNTVINDEGGAIRCEGCLLNILGNTTFVNNSAEYRGGGAIFANVSEVRIGGSATFFNNSGNDGGAVHVSLSELSIGGNTSFNQNSVMTYGDGGAIYSISSKVNVVDSTIFFNNSGKRGGAVYTTRSEVSIGGNTRFNNNSALVAISLGTGGAIYSYEDLLFDISGRVSFTGNDAPENGGAIVIYRSNNCSIIGATFTSNQATDGGAVWVTSSDEEEDDQFPIFRQVLLGNLTFENNIAVTDGGALWLDRQTGSDKLWGSSFSMNLAGASGGALFHTGYLWIEETSFTENAAGVDGLAVVSFGNFDAESVSFSNNSFFCPIGQYSRDGYVWSWAYPPSRHSIVCSRCAYSGVEYDESINFGDEPVCADLPEGVNALSEGTTVRTLNVEKGYYRISADSINILECYNKDACVGGDTVGEYCAPGYEGPSCTVCAESYAPGLGFSCHRCSGQAGKSAVGIGVAVLIVVLVVVAVILEELVREIDDGRTENITDVDGDGGSSSESAGQEGRLRSTTTCWERWLHPFRAVLVKAFPLTSFKTVVVVWQIVTQFAAIAGNAYPDVYEDFISKLSFINVDVGFFVSSSCVLRTNFYHRLLFATILPLVILLVLAGVYHVAKKRNKRSETALLEVKRKHLSVALFIVFFIYSSTSFTIFQTFVCDELDDGVSYLRADYSLTCSSSEHAFFVKFAIFMVLVYPIGVPLVVWLWLCNHNEELKHTDRGENPHLASFSSIWTPYKPSRYYFEGIEFGRRLALTGVAVFVFPGSAAQIAIVLLLALVFVFVSESLSPFHSSIDMGLYRWGNGVVVGSMYVALLLKVDVSREGTDTVSAFAGVLIAANMFMVVAVIAHSAFMVREWRKANGSDEASNESPTELPNPEPKIYLEPPSSL